MSARALPGAACGPPAAESARRRRRRLSVVLGVLATISPARAQEPPVAAAREVAVPDARTPQARERDGRVAGWLAAVLERELGWLAGSYALRVRDGVAEVTLVGNSGRARAVALDRIGPVPGLVRIEVVHAASLPAEPAPERFVARSLGLSQESEELPVGDPFLALLADPKTPQFFASLRHYDAPGAETTAGSVGFGETFGVWRRRGRAPGDGLQIGIAAGLFALFDLESESSDLINADYTIGFPLTWRRGGTSARLRLYHQSSHLGDEFLLAAQPERINLSFESLELLVSREWGPVRAYGGGEVLLHREPADLDRWGAHGGLEYRGTRRMWGIGRFLGGVDLKSWQEHDHFVDTSVVAGFEIGRSTFGARGVRVMLEGYHGYSPHGQFYEDKITYLGLGLYLGF